MALELLEKLSEDDQYEYITKKVEDEFFRQELFDLLTEMKNAGDPDLVISFAMSVFDEEN